MKRCKPIDPKELKRGTKDEKKEHRLSLQLSRKIARDHLCSDPNYYRKHRKHKGKK